MRRWIGALLLIGSLVGSAGCVARVRVYDDPRQAYRRWDSREERAYREFLRDFRRPYRDFSRLSRFEQEEYWRWRRDHPDRDLNRGRDRR
jgi:hypothetical protein